MKRSLVWTALLLFGVALLGAQEPPKGAIGGQVFLDDGTTPAENAVMAVRNVQTGMIARLVADREGRFLFKDLPVGPYQVEANYFGIPYRYPALVRVEPDTLVRLCLAFVTDQRALRSTGAECQVKPVGLLPRYKNIIAGALAGATGVGIVILAVEEEATPTRPPKKP